LLVREEVRLAGWCERKILFRLKNLRSFTTSHNQMNRLIAARAGQLPQNSQEPWPVRPSTRLGLIDSRDDKARTTSRSCAPVPDSRIERHQHRRPALRLGLAACGAWKCLGEPAGLASAGRRIELLNYCPAGRTGPPATLLGRAGTPPKSKPTARRQPASVRSKACGRSRIPFSGRLRASGSLICCSAAHFCAMQME